MAFDEIIGTKATELDPLSGSIPDDQLVLVPDPITGELLRSTFGQMKSDIVLAIGAISYLDQIIEVPQVTDLPQPGVIKTIYVITGAGPDQNKQFRWGGSMYIEFPQGSGDVAAEAIIRGNADAALQAGINAEITNRSNADAALQTNINSEALARANADTILNNKISSEANTRSTNDNILQGLINSEGTIRANADTALSARITAIEGAGGGVAIDDTTPSLTKVFSSQKTQDALDLKLNITDYNPNFRGKYTSLANLQAAVPTALPGNYAQVDTGAGFNVVNYNWDDEDGWVLGSSIGPVISSTDDLVEGSTNLYFTAARAIAAIGTVGVAAGGTGLTSYAKGDVLIATGANVIGVISAGTTDDVFTMDASGVPVWKAISSGLPSMTGNSGKFLTTNGTAASWGAISGWNTLGNAGTDGGITNFIGTTDNVALQFRTNNVNRFSVNANGSFTFKFPYSSGSIFLGIDNVGGAATYISGGVNSGSDWVSGYSLIFGTTANKILQLNNLGVTVSNLTVSGSSLSVSQALNIAGGSGKFSSGSGIIAIEYMSANTWYFGIRKSSSSYSLIGDLNGNISIGNGIPVAAAPVSSVLTLISTTQGFLLPRMNTSQVGAISTPAEALQVYDTTVQVLKLRNASTWNNIVHSNIANAKVTGTPASDGYVILTVGGTDYKFMTTP